MSSDTMLIYVDPINNNNKFYLVVVAGNSLVTTYGRVGSDGIKKTKVFGSAAYAEREAERTIRAKQKKGYEITEVSTGDNVTISTQKDEIRDIALKSAVSGDAASNSIVVDVINRLVQMNAHNIIEASGGKLSVSSNGVVTSALGAVTLSAVSQASILLEELAKEKDSTTIEYSKKLGQYLTLIPQKVPSRNWASTFLNSKEAVAAQRQLLEDIEASLKFAKSQSEDKTQSSKKKNETVVEFTHKISLLEDKKEFARIEKFVKDSANSHHRSAFNMRLKNVYVIENSEEADNKWEEHRKAFGNVQELWHGTGPINILSILKKGFFIPKASGGEGIHIAGRMYGNCLYFSDISTKSLNYSRGSWTGQRYNGSVFMFIADVVMGSEFRPYQNPSVSHNNIPKVARTGKNKKGKSFNSIMATGGRDGVLNNEMMIWNTEQAKLKYLCEFE